MRVVAQVVSVFALIFVSSGSMAQYSDSTVVLDEVLLESTRLFDYEIQGFKTSIDSTTLSKRGLFSIGELIQANGLGLIRSYSPGGLSTASIRGTGSNHTAILWNGINIESPQNGQNDLSQIPLTFFEQASITSGGNASLFGNGSIGGTIQLSNLPSFSEGLAFRGGIEGGSFGRMGGQIQGSYSPKKVAIRTGLMHRKVDNDFDYTYGNDTRTWQHARQRLSGLNQSIDWQISEKHYLYGRVWLQKQDYQVPNPSTVLREGSATQEDFAARSMLGYLYSANNWEVRVQSAFLFQTLDYTDPMIQLVSESESSSIVQQLEATRHLNRTDRVSFGTHFIHEKTATSNYIGTPTRNRWVLAGAYQITPLPKTQIVLSVREEIIDGSTTPIAPGIKVQYQASRSVSAYISMNRSYRIPTFNDLYWAGAGGAGNPNLNPELSLGGELGGTLKLPFMELTAAAYSQRVDDWIQWIPEESAIWTPINLKQVWARGLETTIESSLALADFTIQGSVAYRFTKSTNEKMYDAVNARETGNQLILIPVHSGNISMSAIHPWVNISYVHTITGSQFTDDNNSNARKIPTYGVGTLELDRNIRIREQQFNLNLRIQNILDAEYEARPGFPMPGRNLLLGLTFDLTTSKNN